MDIVSEGFDGKYKLMKDGKPVQIGQVAMDCDGVSYVVQNGTAPHKEGSTGRISVRQGTSTFVREFFPSVLEMKWVKIS